MYGNIAEFGEVNVLASEGGWAWPAACRDIFTPSGVNLLIAHGSEEFVNVIGQRRIHTAIVDIECGRPNGLSTIRLIRKAFPLLPCLLLTDDCKGDILSKALALEVFSVIDKPVDMAVLHRQLDRLFMRNYNSNIFSRTKKLSND